MAAEERFSVSVSFRGDGQDNSHVSFSTYRKTQIQQIVDSAMVRAAAVRPLNARKDFLKISCLLWTGVLQDYAFNGAATTCLQQWETGPAMGPWQVRMAMRSASKHV